MTLYLDLAYTNLIIVACCLLGFLYAIFNAIQLRRVEVKVGNNRFAD